MAFPEIPSLPQDRPLTHGEALQLAFICASQGVFPPISYNQGSLYISHQTNRVVYLNKEGQIEKSTSLTDAFTLSTGMTGSAEIVDPQISLPRESQN